MITTSRLWPGGTRSDRLKTSRINLLARFLRTASPSFREATIPSLAVWQSLGATSTVMYRPFARCDRSKTRWNSSRRLTRCALVKRWDGIGFSSTNRSRGDRLRGGNREAFTSLCAAPFQHLASLLGGHAYEKPMRTLAAPTVWLKRHTHGREPLQRNKDSGET
jgi:hypothetical protein